MTRNCNLELRLVTPSVDFNSAGTTSSSLSEEEKQKKLTIFYNGRMTACDVTEIQARAIIQLASGGETEDRKVRSSCDEGSSVYDSPITSGLSMKRSLQRFLQKRKNRTQAMSPYSRPAHC